MLWRFNAFSPRRLGSPRWLTMVRPGFVRLSTVDFNNKHDHGFADACEGFVKDLVAIFPSQQWPVAKLILHTFLHSLVGSLSGEGWIWACD